MSSRKRGKAAPSNGAVSPDKHTQDALTEGALPAETAAALLEEDGQTEPTHHATVAPPTKLMGVVGIGASAGGLAAFTSLLEHMPGDTGLAFVLVQHLDPAHESLLAKLLTQSTQMPVHEVHQDMPLEANNVYVISPNTVMFVSDGQLSLEARPMRGKNMPIDLFFRSLALDMRERAIGVILSGTGTDGALGLEAIKAEGGFTFAESPDSAQFRDMPSSAVDTGCVDRVLAADEIAREISRLARRMAHTVVEEQDGEGDLQKIFSLLRASKGVDFTNYRHTTIRRRIVRRMALNQVNKLTDYTALVKARPGELEALYQDVLIRVTSFFRDRDVFEALKEKVFPQIVSPKRPSNTPIRVWVPGCATGEEAYSLAICLVEFLTAKRLAFPIQIFATDISEAALEKARAGVYIENISLDVSPERLRRFFSRVGNNYQINQAIRDHCIFARQNLTSDPPFSKLDLVSCRNVLIYLSPVLQRKVLPILHYALKPAGFLVLGGSETTGSAPELFEVVDKKHKIFSKSQAARPALDLPSPPPGMEGARPAAKERPRLEESNVHLAHREANRLALARYAPAGVIITQEMQIVEFRGQTGRYLEPAPGSPTNNLIRMAREGLALELRAAVHKAQKSGEPARTGPIEVRSHGETSLVVVDVTPLRLGLGPRDEGRQYYMVSFEEITVLPSPGKRSHSGKGAERTSAGGESKQVAKLKQELAATREYVQSIIEEMEATNEELQSANEEILSSNEELQSINEELETAKEELQSTNEELTTVNEELRTRNAELAQVNNDLNSALSSMSIPIIMLSADMRIQRFTPMAERVLHLAPSDVGRPLGDIKTKIDEPDIQALVREAIEEVKTVTRDVRDRAGCLYSMRIRPYRTGENKIDGVVVALLDVDDHRTSSEGTPS